jgi:integral membrane protein (TIGR01906 family)
VKGKLLALAQAMVIALLILAGAIALPILCRPFYYLQIAPLGIPEFTGLSVEEIKTAYNEMLNFCIGLTDTFSVGVLQWSEQGRSHFADVRQLFLLDLWVLVGAFLVWIVLRLIQGKKQVRLAGHTPGFWSAIGLGVTFLVTGGLAALDFQKAFYVFHQIFFPGKDNWFFDYRVDPIINILPEAFFRNCAIFILAGILIGCGIALLQDKIARSKKGG